MVKFSTLFTTIEVDSMDVLSISDRKCHDSKTGLAGLKIPIQKQNAKDW